MVSVEDGFDRRVSPGLLRNLCKPRAVTVAGLLLCAGLSIVVATTADAGLAQAVGVVLLFSLGLNGMLIAGMRGLRREAGLRAQAENKLSLTLNNMRDGIVAFDHEHRLVVANRRYQEMHDLSDNLVRPGTPFTAVIDRLRERKPDIPSTEKFISDFLVRLAKGDESPLLIETRNITVAVSYRARPGGGWVATHEDVTQRIQLEKRLNHLALHDALTGLANRVLLHQKLDEAMQPPGRDNDLAVLCLDLDRFKEVNDTLGHPAGDELLRQVAQRLRDCIADTATAARMGGDEFAIIQLAPQPQSAVALATQIIESLATPFAIEGHHVSIGTSIGIAIPPGHGRQGGELLKHADLALYACKAKSRGAYRVFDPSMERRKHERPQLGKERRKRLD